MLDGTRGSEAAGRGQKGVSELGEGRYASRSSHALLQAIAMEQLQAAVTHCGPRGSWQSDEGGLKWRDLADSGRSTTWSATPGSRASQRAIPEPPSVAWIPLRRSGRPR